MKSKPLSSFRLAIINLRQKSFRSFALTVLVFLLAFALFGGSMLIFSLQNGLNNLRARMGADLVIVPRGHETEYGGILLSGTPSKFYLDVSALSKLSEVDGVEKYSSEFYLSSLSEGCCTMPIQIIGIDPKTDFTTMPWVSKVFADTLEYGELIIGSDIYLENGLTELTFFDKTYKVVAQLDESGSGMDCSVFTNLDTVRDITDRAHIKGVNLNADTNGGDINNSVSSVLVKLKDGYDIADVGISIQQTLDDVSVLNSKSIISGTEGSIGFIVNYFYIIAAVIWLLAATVLVIVFSVTVNERKKEFAVFRILGATRKKLFGIVLTEAFITSLLGSVSGVAVASLVVFPFSTYIGDRLGLPYIQPSIPIILLLLFLSLLLAVTVAPLASLHSAVKVSKAETYVTLREGE